jgi:hypothetical protein
MKKLILISAAVVVLAACGTSGVKPEEVKADSVKADSVHIDTLTIKK